MAGIFEQVAIVLAVCAGMGLLAVLARLPLLVGLLIAGIVVGPQVLGFVEGSEEIELLGEIGIALLLFVVGLKLDPRILRKLGPVVLVAGTVQVAVTTALAFGLARLTGVAPVPAGYLAVATAFSSTVVVIKLLGDRLELEQLHGRIAVGILIVQDLIVVLLMILLPATADADADLGAEAIGIVGRGIALVVGVALLARFVLPRIVALFARQTELLVLASVTWAVAVAAAAHVLGFSEEVGAFLAGVALASSSFREAISGRLSTLRDFLLVFFFIDLGTQLELGAEGGLVTAAVLSVFVLVVKPLLIGLITTGLGFAARVGVRAGVTMAQISEFSLILVALGVSIGQIDGDVAGVVTLIAVATITLSTPLSARADALVPRLRGTLTWLERRTSDRDLAEAAAAHAPTIVVLGLGRLGRQLARELDEAGEDVLAVDFDPRHRRDAADLAVLYGDAEDPELPHQLPLDRTRWVVSTLRDTHANRSLAASLRAHGYRGKLAVAADHEHEARTLTDADVDLVFHPFHAAAAPVVAQLASHDDRDL